MALKGGTIVKTMYIAAMRAARVIWTVLWRFILEICARQEEFRRGVGDVLVLVACFQSLALLKHHPAKPLSECHVAGECNSRGKQQTDEEGDVGQHLA